MCHKFALFLATCVGAAIIPEEVPSLLSLAYSNIPPIRKGSDSRIGFGYSFGNHADFQILIELGPQRETNPIGTNFPTAIKRQAPNKVQKVAQHNSRRKQSHRRDSINNRSQVVKNKKESKPFASSPIPGEAPPPSTTPKRALAVAADKPSTAIPDLHKSTEERTASDKDAVEAEIPQEATKKVQLLDDSKTKAIPDVPSVVLAKESR